MYILSCNVSMILAHPYILHPSTLKRNIFTHVSQDLYIQEFGQHAYPGCCSGGNDSLVSLHVSKTRPVIFAVSANGMGHAPELLRVLSGRTTR